MNDRIRELAEQSGVVMRGKFGKPMNIATTIVKFW